MQQCLISIVDILGTKGIWTETSVDKYFEVIERVKQELEKGKEYFQTLPNSQFIEFDFATFSDTLVITLINKGQQYDYFFDETIEGFSRLNLGIFQNYFSDNFSLEVAFHLVTLKSGEIILLDRQLMTQQNFLIAKI